jgi:hypothetical protein
VLAAAGQGRDPQPPDTQEQVRLRRRALSWLRADLDLYAKPSPPQPIEDVLLLIERLSGWQKDTRLATVREAKALALLPVEEQQAWQKLWADANGRLDRVRVQVSEISFQAILTEQQRVQTHTLTMQAGKTYVFDMHSTALDSYLQLYDERGKLLDKNDDIADDNQDARLIFTPPADGTFRLAATSLEQRGRGPYTLTIRTIAGNVK